MIGGLAVAVALLAANAFFVGAEFALLSARRSQIEPLARRGNRRASIVLAQMRHLSQLLAGCQLGITVCSLGLGAVAEPSVAHLLEAGFDAARLPAGVLHPVAFAVALAIVTAAHMVIGEMVPKNLAIAGPERAALLLGPPMGILVRGLRPVIAALNRLANGVLRLLRVEPKDEVVASYTAEQLADVIAESRAEGLLAPQEHDLLRHALDLEEQAAATIVLPPADVVTVPETVTADELERVVAATGYSRFPVRRGDGPCGRGVPGAVLVGYLHAKDTLGVAGPARRRPLPANRVRPLVRVRDDTALGEVLTRMARAGSHLGEVRDAAGRPLGVIAMEDVVEKLVGTVADASHRRP